MAITHQAGVTSCIGVPSPPEPAADAVMLPVQRLVCKSQAHTASEACFQDPVEQARMRALKQCQVSGVNRLRRAVATL